MGKSHLRINEFRTLDFVHPFHSSQIIFSNNITRMSTHSNDNKLATASSNGVSSNSSSAKREKEEETFVEKPLSVSCLFYVIYLHSFYSFSWLAHCYTCISMHRFLSLLNPTFLLFLLFYLHLIQFDDAKEMKWVDNDDDVVAFQ